MAHGARKYSGSIPGRNQSLEMIILSTSQAGLRRRSQPRRTDQPSYREPGPLGCNFLLRECFCSKEAHSTIILRKMIVDRRVFLCYKNTHARGPYTTTSLVLCYSFNSAACPHGLSCGLCRAVSCRAVSVPFKRLQNAPSFPGCLAFHRPWLLLSLVFGGFVPPSPRRAWNFANRLQEQSQSALALREAQPQALSGLPGGVEVAGAPGALG